MIALKDLDLFLQLPLYPTPEQDSPTWAGRLDDITANLENAPFKFSFSTLTPKQQHLST
jgi:hypothetical protein